MSTLTHWSLPVNDPPNPYPFMLQFLTSEHRGRLYYTKYIVDVIGELRLDATNRNVREWTIPPALFGPYPNGIATGITYGPGDLVWVALENAHRIVGLDPATDRFKSFGASEYPIRYPRHLMFDARGGLWYTGMGSSTGALVGRLDPGKGVAVYWDLPEQLLSPEGLWVDSDARSVWVTPSNANVDHVGACLGRLDPATDRLTFWNFPRPGLRPVNAGVTGDRPHNPLNIWFTYMGSGSSSRVFRLHRPSGVFFEYRPVMAFPRRVACDDAGNAWVSDWGGKVSRIRHDADCGTTAFPGKRVTLKRTTRRVKSITRRVQPVVHSVPSTDERVTRARANCYLDYPLPYPANGIQVTGGKAGVRPTVYFTEGLGNIIGRLKP